MKTAFKTLFLVGLAGLQHLNCAQAQVTTTATVSSTSTSLTSVPTPSPPSFVNTPGLVVTSPFDGMSVSQNTVLSISASLAGEKPISSINISVSKKDGSANTTIASITTGAYLKISQTWNITAAQYPVGEYLLHMVIQPNTTANLNGPTSLFSTNTLIPTNTPAPNPTFVPGPPSAGSTVYYWRGTVRVVAPRNSTLPNSASGLKYESLNSRGLGMATTLVAAGIAIFGSLLVL